MRRDRVSEDIHVFISDLYVQVTSTVMLTAEGAIVIDAMPFPAEAREILQFIESRLGPNSVRYVINTHHHADHVYGTFLFEGAEVVSHDVCRELLAQLGPESLAQAKQQTPALAEVEIRLPDITFQGEMHIHLGHRHLSLYHTPGHTKDGISIFEWGERVLIAGDLIMPVPHIVGGNIEDLKASLRRVREFEPEFIVQGHGDVLLRGEIDEVIEAQINYLDTIVARVSEIVRKNLPPRVLREIDIESCGLSRIPLDGAVSRLHLDNLVHLYRKFAALQGRS